MGDMHTHCISPIFGFTLFIMPAVLPAGHKEYQMFRRSL